jgi:hypothetical protein
MKFTQKEMTPERRVEILTRLAAAKPPFKPPASSAHDLALMAEERYVVRLGGDRYTWAPGGQERAKAYIAPTAPPVAAAAAETSEGGT